ncbi:CPBP family intramembrane glutamic endopeptidase [Mollicutes bacterium LVI A0039]|nr:CPBP family intramembrane glutamic endopeptidase [Mollicutes bacterium LVI A0039]
MKKNRHLVTGVAIIGLYYVNTIAINLGLSSYLQIELSKMSADQIIEFIQLYPTPELQSLMYYQLVFKAMLISYLLIISMISIIHRRKIQSKLIVIKSEARTIAMKITAYAMLMLTIAGLIYTFNYLWYGEFSSLVGDNQSMINQVLLSDEKLYVIIVVCFLAPVVEEYIFRYGLINNLFKHRSKVIQVVLPALVFAYIHIGFTQLTESFEVAINLLVLYIPMAAVYCFVYVKEKNIAYPLILHILNNIGSVLIVLIFNSGII